jgi:hypothetical protein
MNPLRRTRTTAYSWKARPESTVLNGFVEQLT